MREGDCENLAFLCAGNALPLLVTCRVSSAFSRRFVDFSPKWIAPRNMSNGIPGPWSVCHYQSQKSSKAGVSPFAREISVIVNGRVPTKTFGRLALHHSTLLLRLTGLQIVQSLLRHASQKVTQDVCDEAVLEEKRKPNDKVVRLVPRPKEPHKGVLEGVAVRSNV